jgi:hypothetical protein
MIPIRKTNNKSIHFCNSKNMRKISVQNRRKIRKSESAEQWHEFESVSVGIP